MDKILFAIFVISVGLYLVDMIFHLGIFDKLEKILEK